MIPDTEPIIKRNDQTPSVLDQAKSNGWEAGIYNFGKAESSQLTYFNPGLVRRPDGLWLLVRRSENVSGSPFGMNAIFAIQLDESGRNPIRGVRLKWDGAKDGQQHEDGRAFYVPSLNQVGIGCCTFLWHGKHSWTGAIQMLGFFDSEWICKRAHYPPYDVNARSLENIPKERYSKNWLWWMHDQRLHMIYKSDPWTVVEFGQRWDEQRTHVNAGARWAYGEPRGGTPPILIDGKYYTIFHSSEAWRGNYRRYYAGAICFSAEPPFEILSMTKEPLLIGSQNDEWRQRKPLCIFPQGAVCENGQWLITAGVNDLRAAWFLIPHSDILDRLGIKAAPLPTKPQGLGRPIEKQFPNNAAPLVGLLPRVKKRKRGKRMTRTKPVQRTPEQQAAIDQRMARVRAAKKMVATSTP